MMKRYSWFLLLLLTAVTFGLASCDDDDNDGPESGFYVRYTVGAKAGDEFFISYKSPKGIDIMQKVSKEGTEVITVGPVSVGFEANIAASVNNGYTADYIQIEVCHEDHPFVLKRFTANARSESYTITPEDR